MKIAIHQPRASYYMGGGERVPIEQAKYLHKLGHEVTFVTTATQKQSTIFSELKKKYPGIKMVVLGLSPKLKKIYKADLNQNRKRCDEESLEFGRLTKKYYTKNKFDVVAVHYTVDALLIPKCQKVFLHLHGCPAHKRNIDKLSIERADRLLCVSRYVGSFWKKMYKINLPIHLNYNGIDSIRFCPKNIKKNVDILYIGRLIKIKGIEDLIKALTLISKHLFKFKVTIVGKGPEKNRLILLAKKLKVDHHISWIDTISDKKLIDTYNHSRLCVFPSTSKEGVLTTMLEAAACGSAIITTNCCSMPEFIRHGRNGFLVRPHAPKELSSAIIKLLANKKLRTNLAASARNSIIPSWTWDKQIKELIKIYKNA